VRAEDARGVILDHTIVNGWSTLTSLTITCSNQGLK